jgi:hypothetical protein
MSEARYLWHSERHQLRLAAVRYWIALWELACENEDGLVPNPPSFDMSALYWLPVLHPVLFFDCRNDPVALGKKAARVMLDHSKQELAALSPSLPRPHRVWYMSSVYAFETMLRQRFLALHAPLIVPQ